MYRKTLSAILALMLSGCSTVAVNSCNPPDFTMTMAAPLAPLPEDGMTMLEAINQWQNDTAQYNGLADKHDTLVTWVMGNC